MKALAILLAAVVGVFTATASATAPGSNGRIAFTRYVDASRSSGSIYTVDANGKNEHRVTRAPAGARDTQPDWSRDGSLIVFERQYEDRDWETYSVRPDGSKLTKIDPGCPDDPDAEICEVSGPALSPDGTRIAFFHAYPREKLVRGEAWIEVGAIAVMNRDGSGMRQLTQLTKPTSSEDINPFWSPTGKQIGFERVNSTAKPIGRQAIFVINADGSGVRRVTPWNMDAGDHPDWSPDGRWILFRSPEHRGFAGTNLFRIHPDGTGLKQLTKTSSKVEMLSASYSPDGTSIVHARTGTGGLPDLWLMRPDGTKLRQLTRTPKWDSAPDWGPAK